MMDDAQPTIHSELDAPMSHLLFGNSREDGSYCESILSAFECLPVELFGEIVQYVPESVLDLRLTSRATRSQVDAFAIASSSVEVVELLMIRIEASTTINVGFRVPEIMRKLYELRLRLSALSIGYDSPYLSSRIKRINQDGLHRTEYKIKCNLLNDAKFLEFLVECCGHRIGTLLLINFGDIQTFITISKMLEHARITNLCCELSQLHDPIATQLLTVIRVNKVERLALNIRDNFCADPATILIEMASLVRALRIVTEADRSEYPYTLLGISDWAPVILAIFAANVDTLHLVECRSPYFGLDVAELLKQRLPHLGKKLWFEAVANGCRGNHKFGINGHLFNLSPMSMSIKHWSRAKEPAW